MTHDSNDLEVTYYSSKLEVTYKSLVKEEPKYNQDVSTVGTLTTAIEVLKEEAKVDSQIKDNQEAQLEWTKIELLRQEADYRMMKQRSKEQACTVKYLEETLTLAKNIETKKGIPRISAAPGAPKDQIETAFVSVDPKEIPAGMTKLKVNKHDKLSEPLLHQPLLHQSLLHQPPNQLRAKGHKGLYKRLGPLKVSSFEPLKHQKSSSRKFNVDERNISRGQAKVINFPKFQLKSPWSSLPKLMLKTPWEDSRNSSKTPLRLAEQSSSENAFPHKLPSESSATVYDKEVDQEAERHRQGDTVSAGQRQEGQEDQELCEAGSGEDWDVRSRKHKNVTSRL